MLSNFLRSCYTLERSIYWAITAKIRTSLHGKSEVSRSCQIPDIRRKFAELSLNEHRGLFVEIGAYDGESMSNTSFLADQGWRGIYVEPIPRYFRRMRLRHMFNDVKGENVAVAGSSGAEEIVDMRALSSMNKATSSHYDTLSWAASVKKDAEVLTIQTEPLDAIFSRNDVPHDFDLLVVDVEGNEEVIIKSLLASRWRPRVLIIELCDVHPDFAGNEELVNSAKRVRAGVKAAGYREYYVDAINTIFVRAD